MTTSPPITRLVELVEADTRTRGSIAAAAGMNPAHFSQIMTGYRADPAIGTVVRILDALGKRLGDLDPPKPSRKARGR